MSDTPRTDAVLARYHGTPETSRRAAPLSELLRWECLALERELAEERQEHRATLKLNSALRDEKDGPIRNPLDEILIRELIDQRDRLQRELAEAHEVERASGEIRRDLDRRLSETQTFISNALWRAGIDTRSTDIEAQEKAIATLGARGVYAAALENSVCIATDYLESNADPANEEDADNWVLPVVRTLRAALAKIPRDGSEIGESK